MCNRTGGSGSAGSCGLSASPLGWSGSGGRCCRWLGSCGRSGARSWLPWRRWSWRWRWWCHRGYGSSFRTAPMRSMERVFSVAVADNRFPRRPGRGRPRCPAPAGSGVGEVRGPVVAPGIDDPGAAGAPAQEDQEEWPKIARRLGIKLGYSLATPVVLDALRLEVRLRREVLPSMLELGIDVQVDGLFDDPHRVPLGVSSLGGRYEWELDRPTNTSMVVAAAWAGARPRSPTRPSAGSTARSTWAAPVKRSSSTPKPSGTTPGVRTGPRSAKPTKACGRRSATSTAR